jgi:hypothetical protein
MGPSGRERRFYDRFLTKSYGFKIYDDVPGKPGIIGNVTGNNFTIVIPPSNVRATLRIGVAKIAYLVSYENMGIFNVTIKVVTPLTATAKPMSPRSAGCSTIELCNSTSTLVDTLWTEKSSISKTLEVKFPLYGETVNSGSTNSAQLMRDKSVHVTITINDAFPRRAENIVKILYIMLY